jgi:acyl carrier protein
VEQRRRVREFVQQNFFVSGPLRDDDSLLDQGIIDSTGVLEVVGFLESEYGIRVNDEEILPDNFDSIAAIAAYVDRKRAAA